MPLVNNFLYGQNFCSPRVPTLAISFYSLFFKLSNKSLLSSYLNFFLYQHLQLLGIASTSSSRFFPWRFGLLLSVLLRTLGTPHFFTPYFFRVFYVKLGCCFIRIIYRLEQLFSAKFFVRGFYPLKYVSFMLYVSRNGSPVFGQHHILRNIFLLS